MCLGEHATMSDAISAEEVASLRHRVRELDPALRESEERFQTLVGGPVQGIMIHYLFKPLFVNGAAAMIFGYRSREDLMAVPSILDLVAPSGRPRIRELGARRIRGDTIPEVN